MINNIVKQILQWIGWVLFFAIMFIWVGVANRQTFIDMVGLDEYEKEQQENVYPKVQEKLNKILKEVEETNKVLPN